MRTVTVDAYDLDALCNAARMLDRTVAQFLAGDARLADLRFAALDAEDLRILERLAEVAR